MTDYYYDDDDDDERRGAVRLLGIGALVIGLVALIWFVVIPWFQGDSVTSTQAPAAATTTVDPQFAANSIPDASGGADETDVVTAETDGPDGTDGPDETDEPDETDVVTGGTPPATTDATVASTGSDEPVSTDSEPPAEQATYPTLPDGSPVPVLAVFDIETITISGVVPTQEAADRLSALAIANSKFPDAEVVSTLTVDPTIPSSVGVRVIEMNSVRFPESSADLLPEHRAEIDRAAEILALFPNVSVLVIGHADQRGSDEANFAISEERARAVSTYIVSTGIDPARVSSRAVGALDLLALANDEQSFALNRRTEFVFYGLLTELE